MTQDERKAIEDIQGTGGFRVILSVLDTALKDLDSVTNIDFHQQNIEAKTIGRSLAVKWCKDIKDEINLSFIERDGRRTYE